MNDPRYAVGDEEYNAPLRSRAANVVFMQKNAEVTKLEQLTEADAVRIIANRNIAQDEEIYVNYGDNHRIPRLQ